MLQLLAKAETLLGLGLGSLLGMILTKLMEYLTLRLKHRHGKSLLFHERKIAASEEFIRAQTNLIQSLANVQMSIDGMLKERGDLKVYTDTVSHYWDNVSKSEDVLLRTSAYMYFDYLDDSNDWSESDNQRFIEIIALLGDLLEEVDDEISEEQYELGRNYFVELAKLIERNISVLQELVNRMRKDLHRQYN